MIKSAASSACSFDSIATLVLYRYGLVWFVYRCFVNNVRELGYKSLIGIKKKNILIDDLPNDVIKARAIK